MTALLLLFAEALLLSLLVLMPACLVLRGSAALRGRRNAALALHRAQLGELERDRTYGLIGDGERDAARLEIERRLLSAATLADPADGGRPGWRGIAALSLVPLAAVALYLAGGHPGLPAQPAGPRRADLAAASHRDDRLVAALRDGLSRLDPTSAQARQGYALLGQAEAARGHWAAAAAAWRTMLAHGFDPAVAYEAAEAQTRADNHVSADSAALFRRALDAAGQDAPWRLDAEQRLAQYEHERGG